MFFVCKITHGIYFLFLLSIFHYVECITFIYFYNVWEFQHFGNSRLLTDFVVWSLSSLFYPNAKRDNNISKQNARKSNMKYLKIFPLLVNMSNNQYSISDTSWHYIYWSINIKGLRWRLIISNDVVQNIIWIDIL